MAYQGPSKVACSAKQQAKNTPFGVLLTNIATQGYEKKYSWVLECLSLL